MHINALSNTRMGISVLVSEYLNDLRVFILFDLLHPRLPDILHVQKRRNVLTEPSHEFLPLLLIERNLRLPVTVALANVDYGLHSSNSAELNSKPLLDESA